jgi:hypothetical protein
VLRSRSDAANDVEARKPLDVGNGVVAASFAPSGAWLSVAAFHPRHGTVELTNLPPFDERLRGTPAAVRRYRSLMTEERYAFLVAEVGREEIASRTAYHPVDDTITQVWRLAAPGALVLRFRGRLAPPALLEITEVSPLPPVHAETVLSADSATLELAAPGLPAAASITVAAPRAEVEGWRLEDGGATMGLAWRDAVELRVTVTLAERPRGGSPQTRFHAQAPAAVQASGRLWVHDAGLGLRVPVRHRDGLARITDGALRYVTGCTQLRVAPREACLLTDHRLLPLSWTRDGYYQALLLLTAGKPAQVEIVADHLRWLFGRCLREGGVWQRSHLANGEPKDWAFQADQQLYPVLELVDFRDAIGLWPDPPPGRSWGELVDEVWRALPITPEGLVRSEENPADDPALPYALSTQILLWYVTRRLARVAGELGLEEPALAGAAERARSAVEELFATEGPVGPLWAYEIDGTAERRLYADANDLPTAFAPVWGFCAPDDELWLGTMRFAFDEANPAYRPGPWGGLGSLHTPGTWPLGDAQEWIFASAVGDLARAERALDRLTCVAARDGLLPEAYDPKTGAWTARHWFAWPAALVGALADATLHG